MVDAARTANPETGRMDLRPLRAHRAFIAIFILSAMLSALVLTYVYSERYRAEVTILFKPSDVTELTTQRREALGSAAPGTSVRNITATINDLVKSQVILRPIVTKLHLDAEQPKDLSGPWYLRSLKELKYALRDAADDAGNILMFGRVLDADPVNQAIIRLRKQIKITSDESYVYSLTVTSDTPQRASAIADEIGVALIDLLHRDDRHTFNRRSEELAGLIRDKTGEIERIETNLQDLLANNQVASIKDELEKITDRASKLRQQQTDATADLRQSEAKVAAQAEKLRVASPPASARDDDANVTRRPSRISADDYAKLTSNKLDAEVNSASLRARLGSLDRSYAALVIRLQVLTRVQAEYDLMSARLKSATRDYATLSDALQEVAVRTTSSPNELRILAKAMTPGVPVSPIKIYHVLVASTLAALIAMMLVYVLDYLDIRLFLPPARGKRRDRLPSRGPAPEPSAARVATDLRGR